MSIDVLVTYDADFADLLFGDECEKVERIVRCKDCKFFSSEPWLHYNDSVTDANCWIFQDYEETPATVEPDGFCAWGERREC